MANKTVRTMRHSLSVRLTHWTIVIEGAFLLITGFQLNGLFPFGLGENTYGYHLITAMLFMATAFVLFYVVVAIRDYKWFAIRRIPYSFRYIIRESLYWFRMGPKPDEPIKFDATKGEYVEKLIPSVIVVWWAYALMGIVLSLTGLADAYPATFGFLFTIFDPLGIALFGVGGLSFALAVHRIVTFLLIAVVAMHLYASFVYRLLGSITHGYRNEPAVDGGEPKNLPGGPPNLGGVSAGARPAAVAAKRD